MSIILILGVVFNSVDVVNIIPLTQAQSSDDFLDLSDEDFDSADIFGVLEDDSSKTSTANITSSSDRLFSDVRANSIFEDYLKILHYNKVIQGYEDNTFRPQRTINRAEALKMLFESLETSVGETSTPLPFPDVPRNEWYRQYVSTAHHLGMIKGYPDGKFKPTQNVNRVEFIKIAVLAHLGTTNNINESVALNQFNDIKSSEWYVKYLSQALQEKILVKQSRFRPGQAMNRADAAEVISRILLVKNGYDPNKPRLAWNVKLVSSLPQEIVNTVEKVLSETEAAFIDMLGEDIRTEDYWGVETHFDDPNADEEDPLDPDFFDNQDENPLSDEDSEGEFIEEGLDENDIFGDSSDDGLSSDEEFYEDSLDPDIEAEDPDLDDKTCLICEGNKQDPDDIIDQGNSDSSGSEDENGNEDECDIFSDDNEDDCKSNDNSNDESNCDPFENNSGDDSGNGDGCDPDSDNSGDENNDFDGDDFGDPDNTKEDTEGLPQPVPPLYTLTRTTSQKRFREKCLEETEEKCGNVRIKGVGNHKVNGSRRSDLLTGGSGKDSIRGFGGHDWIYGGKHRDVLAGYAGHDSIYGGKGRDTLIGGSGHDYLVGGDGIDRYKFGETFDRDRIDDTTPAGGLLIFDKHHFEDIRAYTVRNHIVLEDIINTNNTVILWNFANRTDSALDKWKIHFADKKTSLYFVIEHHNNTRTDTSSSTSSKEGDGTLRIGGESKDAKESGPVCTTITDGQLKSCAETKTEK